MSPMSDDTNDLLLIDDLSTKNVFYYTEDYYAVSNDTLKENILAALAGDIDSAHALAVYYGFNVKDKHDESIKWYMISAEHGHYEGQYMLANFFLNFSTDYDSKIRGVFWLYMMAKDDYRETRNWLRDIGYSLDTARPPDDFNFSVDYSNLTETVIKDYKTNTLKGGKKVAWALGKYYEEMVINKDISEYWYRIGAQNGSTECQYELGKIMIGKEDEFNQVRGKYWLDRSETRNIKK